MSHIAITGGTGFVGSHVLEQAAAAGHPVRALARRIGTGGLFDEQPGREWQLGTLHDEAALAKLCDGADAVIHIAGAVNVPSKALFDLHNNIGTANVVKAARHAGVRRFIHVSSLSAREPGLSTYGWSKAEGEARAADAPLPIIVRPPGVYGPRDTDVLEMFRMAAKGFMLLPPPGRASWIHAADLARLLLALVDDGPSGTILEPDDGQPMSHIDTARLIGQAVGRPHLRTLSAPRWLLKVAARGDRLVRRDAAKLTPDRARYMAHPDWTSDPAKRPDPTLWRPYIGPEQGFADTARWYCEHGWL
ncbi:NAD-dependent epimerase/dehydratase family protein [Sphingomonas lacunae]|uniref:NAD-dependent epimerase/dehydratase family protein n=1 Tax=Sphingomonas lacunae TaxID=2698828 RepID=A0A6M4AQK8_9SPHN|nr:NAD-dependent epimerase/dehydratase family protein [Sphingomonas lacunae]QJQ31384.1 NAD-dependent epimerase/dehydratase family protein [Sphingomonas lacunae]